jgi:AcrR family transcriptional regulator
VPRVEQGGRTALLEAAVTVIADDGLRGLTYRAVGARAGVAHSLVRHHFGTREALIAEALSFGVELALAESSVLPGVDSVDELAEGLVESVIEHAAIHAFQYELVLESRRRSDLTPIVERYYARYQEAITEQLRRLGIDDAALADVVWLALDALVFRLLVLGDRDAASRTISTLRGLLAARVAS